MRRHNYRLFGWLLLTILMVLPYTKVVAQTQDSPVAPIPMLQTGNKWNVMTRQWNNQNNQVGHLLRTETYIAEETQEVGNKQYFKLSIYDAEGKRKATHLLREDIDAGKVYWLAKNPKSGQLEEYLIFDYNITVGDKVTLQSISIINDLPKVSTLKSITTEQIAGKERRVYEFSSGATFYEGIGFNEQAFWVASDATGIFPDELICFKASNGDAWVKNPDQGCEVNQFIPTSTQVPTSQAEDHLEIEIISGFVHLKTKQADGLRVFIYKADGTLLHTAVLKNGISHPTPVVGKNGELLIIRFGDKTQKYLLNNLSQ